MKYTDGVEEDLGEICCDEPLQLTERFLTQVISRLPPIYPQWIDNDGNVIDSIPGGVRLGQTMPLRINAVIKQSP